MLPEMLLWKLERRTWRTIADEHSIILPIIVINFVLSQGSWKDLPRRVLQADLETLEVIRTLLSRWSWGSGKLSRGWWIVNNTAPGLWL